MGVQGRVVFSQIIQPPYKFQPIPENACPALAAGPASTSGHTTKCAPGAGLGDFFDPPPHRAAYTLALCDPAARAGFVCPLFFLVIAAKTGPPLLSKKRWRGTPPG